ncbi:MAG: acyl-CoA dehydrogenase family protein, partial [Actinomycetota bacterium]
MDFEWSEDEKAFQREVREFIRDHSSPEVTDPRRDGMAQLVDSPERRDFMKEMSKRGWIGLSWP